MQNFSDFIMKCAIFEEHSSSCVVYSRFSGTLFPVSMIDGDSASILFCKAIQLKTNLFIFFKNPAGFFPHNLKWEKNPTGEIKGWN